MTPDKDVSDSHDRDISLKSSMVDLSMPDSPRFSYKTAAFESISTSGNAWSALILQIPILKLYNQVIC